MCAACLWEELQFNKLFFVIYLCCVNRSYGVVKVKFGKGWINHLTPTDAVCRLLRYSIEFLGSALHCLTTVYKSCWFISHMSYSTHLSSFTFRLFIFIMSSRKGQFYIYSFRFALVYFLNTFIVYYFVFFVDHVVQNNFINEHYWNYLLKII